MVTAEEAQAYAAMEYVDPEIMPIRLARTVVQQSELIAAALALHSAGYDGLCEVCESFYPCWTARALGWTK